MTAQKPTPTKSPTTNPGGPPSDPSIPSTESGAQRDDERDPARRRTHGTTGSDDELGRGGDTDRAQSGDRREEGRPN